MNYACLCQLLMFVVSGTPTLFVESWSTLAGHKAQCEDKGMRLCTYDELCPNGDGGTPAVGQLNMDQHVVIQADSSFHQAAGCFYEDIQIGNYHNPPVCKGYFKYFRGQGHCTQSTWWGNQETSNYWQARIVCCSEGTKTNLNRTKMLKWKKSFLPVQQTLASKTQKRLTPMGHLSGNVKIAPKVRDHDLQGCRPASA